MLLPQPGDKLLHRAPARLPHDVPDEQHFHGITLTLESQPASANRLGAPDKSQNPNTSKKRNPKPQTPNPKKDSNSNFQQASMLREHLDLEIWDLFGVWCLG